MIPLVIIMIIIIMMMMNIIIKKGAELMIMTLTMRNMFKII